ncbi:hypothetical protein M378DRAFT_620558 [Amanita muscaria Koide BX008]|uniref:RRM domain-containing protein n=1 Tax=Amanita muscaria (strain Koide BX008) TaxID=946122 RepID=A0A0C2TSW6_AMAMK|nr:hypothetical protein M378DRAFT_620558 [Amanita muscaria Koide BX008]
MSSNQDPMYPMANSQNGIYPNMIHANNFDFIPDMDPSKQQQQQQLNTAKLGGYDAAYRPFGYTTNTIRQRHQPNSSLAPQYRENYYQNQSDMFNVTPPLQMSASSAYDYTPQTGHNFKQYSDSFVHSSQTLQAPHPLASINGNSNVTAANKGFNPHTHFSGGVQLASQTPFGPHIPVNVPPHMTNGLNNASSGNVAQSSAAPSTSSSIATGQEEISTIFVVGFPDDMQEREFQNMFTFSQGFEAATLKIPNKDNTNYAGTGRPYGASADPFSLVPPNQGTSGVIDGGRDGNWPGDDSSVVAQFGNNGSAPPRKQIIGFAKFRTRQDALMAKDLLQGKRIDMEKGAVLKAEMAKKNLHTKRGVGTMPIHTGLPSAGATSMTGMTSNFGVYQQPNINGFGHGPDPYTANGADPLGASNGLSLKRVNQTLVHETNHNMLREEDEARRREGTVNSIGFGSMTIRGPRADEEERERRKDKEFRLRNGAPAFDPFNSSFQPQSYADISRPSVTGLRSATEVNGFAQHDTVGPWDNIKAISAQQTPARSTSPTLSAPPLPTSALDAPLTMERRASSGPRYPSGESESQSDGDYYATKANEMSKSFNGLSLSTSAGDTSPQLPSPASNASSSVSRSIDQNPPINTLYVGNLPSGVEQLEEKLRELFNAQPGFRRLCFRQKNNGPMCFVEFDDVNFATKALNILHSHTLDGLVKGTGIRLSYSKNPLGVRTPTSACGLMQQQQFVDALQSRPVDDPLQSKPCTVRRDASFITSPPVPNGTQSSFGNSFLASPPPRFYSSSPSMLTSFTSGTSSQPGSSFPRNSASNILNLYNPPLSFAPFGFPSTSVANIPDSHSLPLDEQNSANSHTVQQHYHRVMSPPTVTLEAARAG